MLPIAFRLAQSGLAIYGALYLVTSIAAPSWFLDNFSLDRLEQPGSARWRVWVKLTLILLGTGTLIYAALYAVVAAVPFSFGGYNDDGNWESTRDSIRIAVAIVSTLGIVSAIERNAEATVLFKLERLARRALQEAISNSQLSSPELVTSVTTNVKRALVGFDFETMNWGNSKRELLIKEIFTALERSPSARRRQNFARDNPR